MLDIVCDSSSNHYFLFFTTGAFGATTGGFGTTGGTTFGQPAAAKPAFGGFGTASTAAPTFGSTGMCGDSYF